MPEADIRERLIEAARYLFLARSYESVGVQDICDRAEVRKGSFYYYFPSKHALMLQAMDADWEALRHEVFEPAFGDDLPPLERFDRFIELVYSYQVRLRLDAGAAVGCPIANLGDELSTIDTDARNKVSELLQHMASYFEKALNDAVRVGEHSNIDTRTTATRILAYIEGLLLLSKAQDDPEVIRRVGLNASSLATPA